MGNPLRHCVLALLLLFCNGPQAEEGRSLSFGVMPYLSTRTLIATYAPLATYLTQRLQRPVQLQTAPDFKTFIRRAFAGDYDLLLIAPHYGRLAETEYGYLPLLRHRNDIRCFLVAPRERPLSSLEQLRGQTVAIHERSALVPLLGLHWLKAQGLEEGRDFQTVENVTQTSALQSAVNGKTRAAIVSYSTLNQAPIPLQAASQVFGECPSAPGLTLMANPRLSTEQRRQLKEMLLGFEQTAEGKVFFQVSTHGGYRESTAADARLLDKMLPETRRLLKE